MRREVQEGMEEGEGEGEADGAGESRWRKRNFAVETVCEKDESPAGFDQTKAHSSAK
jgi:hypothetical protein